MMALACQCGVFVAGLFATATWFGIFSVSRQSAKQEVPKGFVVHSKVIHSRFLPETTAHSFTYPTISFLLSLASLEQGSLDLCGGWLFSYGGLYGRVTGIRASGYLTSEANSKSVKERLKRCIEDHGLCGNDLDDAWMLTMPSYFGMEGINPLTVYFCYRKLGDPWLVVLEIHNTFGEKHIHVLQTAASESGISPQGMSHQWTFRREFHVSPFNDRSGYYKVSANVPPAPSLLTHDTAAHINPNVRVLLYTEADSGPPDDFSAGHLGPLKLAAYLTPQSCTPLTSGSLLKALALHPITLLLSLPRILFQAWILHYRKRLNVYVRPEPLPVSRGWGESASRSGGVGWQPESWIDGFARTRFEAFLGRRSRKTQISAILVPADPAIPQRHFHPGSDSGQTPSHAILTISYLSSAFFTMLLTAPSPDHALLLCSSSNICQVSSLETFRTLLTDGVTEPHEPLSARHELSRIQRLRVLCIPSSVRNSRPDITIPSRHPLDPDANSPWVYLKTFVAIAVNGLQEKLEGCVYRWLGARFVAGQEPWRRWHRALSVESVDSAHEMPPEGELRYRLGSYVDDI